MNRLTPVLLLGVILGTARWMPLSSAQNSAEIAEAPKLAAVEAKKADRTISAHDILYVEVYGEKDLTGERQVQATGNISFPFLEIVPVAGRTPAEVETYIKERLDKDYLVEPQVTVSVRRYVQRTVRVLGEVNQPGLIELPSDQQWELLDAIAAARGFTRVAKSSITVIRKGVEHRFDVEKLKKNIDPAKRFFLEPGDVITVDDKLF